MQVISMLHMSKDSVADVMDVFDAELLLLSQLSSPNIVKVHYSELFIVVPPCVPSSLFNMRQWSRT